jgi:hypothetical protein
MWAEVEQGKGDDFHRCVIAHFLAGGLTSHTPAEQARSSAVVASGKGNSIAGRSDIPNIHRDR